MVVLLRPDEFADVRMQVFPHRRAVVDHRIDQVLRGEFWPRRVAGVKRSPRRESAAAAFAFYTDAGGIEPELSGIRVQPDKHRVDVLQRRRMWRFRREAIIY